MATCSIMDCDDEATSRGLCAKHYMRWRRHGDSNAVQKSGRKRKSIGRQMFEHDWSPRTIARFDKAHRLAARIHEVAGFNDAFEKAVQSATRPDGSLNVSKLLDTIEMRGAMLIAEKFPAR